MQNSLMYSYVNYKKTPPSYCELNILLSVGLRIMIYGESHHAMCEMPTGLGKWMSLATIVILCRESLCIACESLFVFSCTFKSHVNDLVFLIVY